MNKFLRCFVLFFALNNMLIFAQGGASNVGPCPADTTYCDPSYKVKVNSITAKDSDGNDVSYICVNQPITFNVTYSTTDGKKITDTYDNECTVSSSSVDYTAAYTFKWTFSDGGTGGTDTNFTYTPTSGSKPLKATADFEDPNTDPVCFAVEGTNSIDVNVIEVTGITVDGKDYSEGETAYVAIEEDDTSFVVTAVGGAGGGELLSWSGATAVDDTDDAEFDITSASSDAEGTEVTVTCNDGKDGEHSVTINIVVVEVTSLTVKKDDQGRDLVFGIDDTILTEDYTIGVKPELETDIIESLEIFNFNPPTYENVGESETVTIECGSSSATDDVTVVMVTSLTVKEFSSGKDLIFEKDKDIEKKYYDIVTEPKGYEDRDVVKFDPSIYDTAGLAVTVTVKAGSSAETDEVDVVEVDTMQAGTKVSGVYVRGAIKTKSETNLDIDVKFEPESTIFPSDAKWQYKKTSATVWIDSNDVTDDVIQVDRGGHWEVRIKCRNFESEPREFVVFDAAKIKLDIDNKIDGFLNGRNEDIAKVELYANELELNFLPEWAQQVAKVHLKAPKFKRDDWEELSITGGEFKFRVDSADYIPAFNAVMDVEVFIDAVAADAGKLLTDTTTFTTCVLKTLDEINGKGSSDIIHNKHNTFSYTCDPVGWNKLSGLLQGVNELISEGVEVVNDSSDNWTMVEWDFTTEPLSTKHVGKTRESEDGLYRIKNNSKLWNAYEKFRELEHRFSVLSTEIKNATDWESDEPNPWAKGDFDFKSKHFTWEIDTWPTDRKAKVKVLSDYFLDEVVIEVDGNDNNGEWKVQLRGKQELDESGLLNAAFKFTAEETTTGLTSEAESAISVGRTLRDAYVNSPDDGVTFYAEFKTTHAAGIKDEIEGFGGSDQTVALGAALYKNTADDEKSSFTSALSAIYASDSGGIFDKYNTGSKDVTIDLDVEFKRSFKEIKGFGILGTLTGDIDDFFGDDSSSSLSFDISLEKLEKGSTLDGEVIFKIKSTFENILEGGDEVKFEMEIELHKLLQKIKDKIDR